MNHFTFSWKVNLSSIFLSRCFFSSLFFCSPSFCLVLQFFNRKIIYHFFYRFKKYLVHLNHKLRLCVQCKRKRNTMRPIAIKRSSKFHNYLYTTVAVRVCTKHTHSHTRPRTCEKSWIFSIYLIHLVSLILASFAGQQFMKGSVRYIITWKKFDTFSEYFFALSRPVQLFTLHCKWIIGCVD